MTSNTNSVVHSVFPLIQLLQYVNGKIIITNNCLFVFLLFILSQHVFQKTRPLALLLAFFEPRKECTVFLRHPVSIPTCLFICVRTNHCWWYEGVRVTLGQMRVLQLHMIQVAVTAATTRDHGDLGILLQVALCPKKLDFVVRWSFVTRTINPDVFNLFVVRE